MKTPKRRRPRYAHRMMIADREGNAALTPKPPPPPPEEAKPDEKAKQSKRG